MERALARREARIVELRRLEEAVQRILRDLPRAAAADVIEGIYIYQITMRALPVLLIDSDAESMQNGPGLRPRTRNTKGERRAVGSSGSMRQLRSAETRVAEYLGPTKGT